MDTKLETLTCIWLEGKKLGEKFVVLVAIEDMKGGRNGLYAESTLLESSSDGLMLGTKPCIRLKRQSWAV